MEDFMNRATIKVIGVGGAGGNAIKRCGGSLQRAQGKR